MSLKEYVVKVQLPNVVIARGRLGTIRIGPTDIEIPGEDVSIPFSEVTVDLEPIIKTALSKQLEAVEKKLKEAEKKPELYPAEKIPWPAIKEKGK